MAVKQSIYWVGFGAFVSGCALFEELKGVVDELTEPVVMQAVAIGVDDGGFDLTGTEYEHGGAVQVWVTDANTSSGFSPATNARVSVISDANGSFALLEVEPGHYAVTNEEGLRYSPNDDIEIVSEYAGERQRITMRTPPAAEVDIPAQQPAGLGMNIDLTGQGFDNAMIVVFALNAVTGRTQLVWQAEYDKTQPRDASNLEQDIPPSVFEQDHLFVIGVAGLTAADQSDLHGLQNLGSGMLAGSMVLNLVSTFDDMDTGYW